MRHYFIGIKIPTLFEQQVEAFRNRYKLHELYKVIPHIEDLHVTLLFLGGIPDEQLPLVSEQLTQIAQRHSPFSMNVDGLSYFGSSQGPRVVYLSVTSSDSLTKLQKDINTNVTQALSIPYSDRFVPHVTIAKKRKGNEPFPIQKEKMEPVEVKTKEFTLFTIHPQRSPKYEAVETFHLHN